MSPPAWQYALDAYIPLVTANLSVIGSGLIIYTTAFLGKRTKLRKPQHRILLAMSCYDICYSFVRAWTFLFAPKGYGVPGAQGNMQTCRMQAFFIQTTRATGAYYALLSIYNWLTICRGVQPAVFAKYERYIHALIFVVFVGLAIAGVVLDLFAPAFSFCYIAPHPSGCENGEGTPQCSKFSRKMVGILYEIFGQMWVQAFIVIVTVTNILIWNTVHKQEKKMRTYAQMPTRPLLGLTEEKKQVSMSRMVAEQSTLYVLGFIFCWIGPTIFHLVGWLTGFKTFWVSLVIAIFTPLQGFLNAVIFARPTYMRIRKKHPKVGRFCILKATFLETNPLAKICEIEASTEENGSGGRAKKPKHTISTFLHGPVPTACDEDNEYPEDPELNPDETCTKE